MQGRPVARRGPYWLGLHQWLPREPEPRRPLHHFLEVDRVGGDVGGGRQLRRVRLPLRDPPLQGRAEGIPPAKGGVSGGRGARRGSELVVEEEERGGKGVGGGGGGGGG